MSQVDAIEIHAGTEIHVPFVLSSWLKTYKYSSPFARRIRNEIYYKRHHAIATAILNRASTKVYIATPKGEPDVYLGYLVIERSAFAVIHFCYVKTSFRRLGIMSALLKAARIVPEGSRYTHRTYDVDWLDDKYPGLIHDPYLL